MTDKERILYKLVQRLFPKVLFPDPNQSEIYRFQQANFDGSDLQKGDLVVATTTIRPNDFLVGFFEKKVAATYFIREIGTKNITHYSNETFYRIPKELLRYEILEGVQYKTYEKCCKALNNCNVGFKDIQFEPGNQCILFMRKHFSSECIGCIQFHYTSKTSIKSIQKLIEDKMNCS